MSTRLFGSELDLDRGFVSQAEVPTDLPPEVRRLRPLASLFEQLDVREYLAKYVPGKESIMALTDHMFTPGRADNNLRQASEDDVRALLDEAIDPLRL